MLSATHKAARFTYGLSNTATSFIRVTAARLNCAPVRSLKVSTDLGGCAVTMRCTSASDFDYLLCATVGEVDEEDLLALVGYKANVIHTEPLPAGCAREHPQADVLRRYTR